jgi:hypothetical protein
VGRGSEKNIITVLNFYFIFSRDRRTEDAQAFAIMQEATTKQATTATAIITTSDDVENRKQQHQTFIIISLFTVVVGRWVYEIAPRNTKLKANYK